MVPMFENDIIDEFLVPIVIVINVAVVVIVITIFDINIFIVLFSYII